MYNYFIISDHPTRGGVRIATLVYHVVRVPLNKTPAHPTTGADVWNGHRWMERHRRAYPYKSYSGANRVMYRLARQDALREARTIGHSHVIAPFKKAAPIVTGSVRRSVFDYNKPTRRAVLRKARAVMIHGVD